MMEVHDSIENDCSKQIHAWLFCFRLRIGWEITHRQTFHMYAYHAATASKTTYAVQPCWRFHSMHHLVPLFSSSELYDGVYFSIDETSKRKS